MVGEAVEAFLVWLLEGESGILSLSSMVCVVLISDDGPWEVFGEGIALSFEGEFCCWFLCGDEVSSSSIGRGSGIYSVIVLWGRRVENEL